MSAPDAPSSQQAVEPLGGRLITPLMVDLPRPFGGRAFPRAAVLSAPADRLSLLGVIEAPRRDMRLVVIAINGRAVHGRSGELVDERYRIGAFTDQRAELIDVATDAVIEVAPTAKSDAAPEPAPKVAAGALRVVGEPPSAEIYVDGAYVGTVAEIGDAADGLPLEAGSHQLDFQAPDHQPVGLAVRISPNRTTTYRVALIKEQR
jgi:hypothetical protein